MATKQDYDAAYNAVYMEILKKIRAEVPSIFEGKAEIEVPKHKQDILDIAKAAVDAVEARKNIVNPDVGGKPPPGAQS